MGACAMCSRPATGCGKRGAAFSCYAFRGEKCSLPERGSRMMRRAWGVSGGRARRKHRAGPGYERCRARSRKIDAFTRDMKGHSGTRDEVAKSHVRIYDD